METEPTMALDRTTDDRDMAQARAALGEATAERNSVRSRLSSRVQAASGPSASGLPCRFGPFVFARVAPFGGYGVRPPRLPAAFDAWTLSASAPGVARPCGEAPPSVLLGPFDKVIHASGDHDRLLLVFKAHAVWPTRTGPSRPEAVTGAKARVLAGHLHALEQLLPTACPADLEELAEATRGLLSASARRNGSVEAFDRVGSTLDQRRFIERIIEENIASARLDTRRIAALAGVSRSTLYRCFHGAGGVAAHVRGLRLKLAHADLLDPGLARMPINELAQRRGFHCAASFSRAFRCAFGMTPGDLRAAAREARPTPVDAKTAHQTDK
jgi:AraC-like DNA-binding protein